MLETVKKCVWTLFYLYWSWRIGSFWYSSYALAEMVTPRHSSVKVKGFVMVALMVSCAILQAVPLEQYPILCLASTVASIPSQIHTIIIVHQYLRPALNNIKYSVLLYVASLLSVLETVYIIYVDCGRIMELEYV